MHRPPDPGAQRPPVAEPGGEQSDLADRHPQGTTPGYKHNANLCATCTPRPISFIGTPARRVAGEILSGAKMPAEIAVELVDVLGPTTAILLAHEIAARVAAVSQQATL